ncbi:MAG: hypothetical protein L0191_13025, partial [Acidobacteria bacterium]|nr:hypothetical protein [Acidobacteriota bacterium]
MPLLWNALRYPLNPLFVALLAIFAAYVYAWVNVSVVLPTAGLYLGALLWFWIRGRKKVLPVAPEEVAARIAEQLARQQQTPGLAPAAVSSSTTRGRSRAYLMLERVTGAMMLLGLLALVWMVLRAVEVLPVLVSERMEVTLMVA